MSDTPRSNKHYNEWSPNGDNALAMYQMCCTLEKELTAANEELTYVQDELKKAEFEKEQYKSELTAANEQLSQSKKENFELTTQIEERYKHYQYELNRANQANEQLEQADEEIQALKLINEQLRRDIERHKPQSRLAK
jgi:chromosome segregation ATPase